jgi:serine/threonine protein kinase/formylglycine-generating enzyme required for sulfatase activity
VGGQVIDIPGYVIKREIGAGGMATVHLATQTSLEREVALKVMSPALAADPTFSKRFLQEARMLASLAHPNIVAVYDVGVTPNQLHYFSMQYLPGGDLAGRVRRGIEERDLVIAIAGVAKALGYAHQRGYVHRDVAPGNILYDANNNPVLTDFGIALAAASGSRITSAGFSVGTSHYMSPEQARGGDVDARSDIYSLGVLTYFGLTGKPPYDGSDGFAVAYAHVFEAIPRLPPEKAHWQSLIDRALAKDPKDRFDTTEQFLEGLAAAVPQYGTLFRDDMPAAPAPRPAASTAVMSMPAARPAGSDVATKVPRSAPEPSTPPRAKNTPTSTPAVSAEKKPASGLMRWWPVFIVLIGVGLIAFAMLARKPAPRPAPTAQQPAPTPAQSPPPPAPVSPPPSAPAATPANETPAVASNDAPPPAPTSPPPTSTNPPTAMDAVEAADAQAAGVDPTQLIDLPTVVDPVVEAVRLGRIDFAAQRLTTPQGNNAFERFQLALKLDPKNKQARQGIVDIAKRYVEIGEKNRAANDLAAYDKYLKTALDVGKNVPDDTEVPKAVAQSRQTAAAPFIAQGKTAASAGDKTAAKVAYEKAQQLDPDSEAVKEGLKYVATIGEPGFAFHDKMGDGQGPEMVIVDARLAMARHDVTRGEFRRFWNAAGKSQFPAGEISCRDRESLFRSSKKRTWENPDVAQDDSHPVVCVSWPEAAAYAQWLSKQTGKHYRLMTAAEFDSAVRKASTGACKANLADAAFNKTYDSRDGADCDDGFSGTSPVGRFGGTIADIDGNVRTWVGACGNGSAADVGSRCRDFLVKGRGWLSQPNKESPNFSDTYGADVALNTVGFRLVRDLEK